VGVASKLKRQAAHPMARPSKPVYPAPDSRIGDDYWLRFGSEPNPTVRERIVYLTIEELTQAGPGDFNAKDVCDRLGVKYPMINYYFGGRDGLIAEAVALEYERSVNMLKEVVTAAPKDPEKRIRAWIKHDVDSATRHKGLGVMLQYPIISKGSYEILTSEFHDRLKVAFEFYLAIVSVLVADVRAGRVTDIDFDAHTVPRRKLLANPSVALDTTSAVWAVHGLVMWSTGSHLVSSRSSDPEFSTELAVRRHVTNIIGIARGD
jgi:AcrR family transcriptional regulator